MLKQLFSPTAKAPASKRPRENDDSPSESSPSNSPPTVPIPSDANFPEVYIPKGTSATELGKCIASLAAAVQNLQQQNAVLIKEVSDLKKSAASTNPKTFAQIVAKSISSPSSQVTYMKAAELAKNRDQRDCSIIVRNADVATDSSSEADLLKKISSEFGVQTPEQVFRLGAQADHPPLLKIKFSTKEEATKVLATFEQNKKMVTGLRTATVRPDLSKPELIKFRQAWKEVISRNNNLGKRIWTVRNLEPVKIAYKSDQEAYPWTIRKTSKVNSSQ